MHPTPPTAGRRAPAVAAPSLTLHPPTLLVGLLAVLLASLLATLAPPAPAQATGAPAARPTGTAFQIATFNVLGSQHTLGKGGWGPGTMRARVTAGIIENAGIDVVGLQEVQEDQLRVLDRELDGYAIWPGTALGGGGLRLQIAWKRWKFDLLDSGSIMTAFDRQVRPVPWVLLEHRATGRKLYVVDVHNSPRALEHERDSATNKEVQLVRRLEATGRSVFVVGDMNEHAEVFCKLVGRTDLVAANGGSARSASDCTPPPGRLHIDWIFGSGPMSFTRYGVLADDPVRIASDHDLIRATVVLRPKRS